MDIGSGNTSIFYGVDRRPVKVYRLWSGPPTNSLVAFWQLPNAVDILISFLNADYALGFRRFCLYLPGGSFSTAYLNPNHWFTMPVWLRQDISTKLKSWISSHTGVYFAVYTGLLFVPDLAKIGLTQVDPSLAVVPNLSNIDHAVYFFNNWNPWFQAGINALVFEGPNTIAADNSIISSAYSYWFNDIKVGGGVYPTIAGVPQDNYFLSAIWVDYKKNIENVSGSSAWIFDQNNTEAGVHFLPEDGPTVDDVSNYSDRNFVLWSWGGYLDNLIINAHNQSILPPAPLPNLHKYVVISDKSKDQIEGFGFPRYSPLFGGVVGENVGVDFSAYDVIAKANSIDGTFSFNMPLNKFLSVSIDVTNPVFQNTGLPHTVIEDTAEWVNSGAPSHLSQVIQSNILNLGIFFEKTKPDQQSKIVGQYQSKYVIPCSVGSYDIFNSTVDYSSFIDNGNDGAYLPYATCVAFISGLSQVWVGGPGGVLSIDIQTKNVEFVNIDNKRALSIKSIQEINGMIYILDENGLYIYNIQEASIQRDPGLGLPVGLQTLAILLNSNIVIGANDGIYAKQQTQDTWNKVVTASSVDIMTNPDAVFVVASRNTLFYSTDGFSWTNVGIFSPNIEVNKLKKHRSQIFIGTTGGLYQDSGAFYSGSLSMGLVDILNDPVASTALTINDIDSNFTNAIIGLSDGRYVVYDTSFSIFNDSILSSIHKVLFVNGDIWLFGFDMFKLQSETFIRKLGTGSLLR